MASEANQLELLGVIEALRAENAVLVERARVLEATNASLAEELAALADKLAELERKLSRNSSNSSLPPSSDRFGRKEKPENANRAARRAKGRKPGKQPGEDGRHLAQVADPDELVTHAPRCCGGCGADLSEATVEGVEVRQVFDLPEPKMATTEHRAETRRCRCGRATKAAFPTEARAYACYGPRLRGVAVYLLARQHLPFERCQEAIFDLFGVSVSTGFLDSLFSEGADGLDAFLAEVLEQLRAAQVVHVDETTDKVKTETVWFHVACTELLTLLHADETRGKAGVERAGLFPDYEGVAVHDRLGWYFSYERATHAACGAHLLRDLASVATIARQRPWATAMAALMLEMKGAAEAARRAGATRLNEALLAGFLDRYDTLVADAFAANPAPARKRNTIEAEGYNLAVAFRDRKGPITRFATDLRVSFTNNQAERDLRMLKIHRKVSSCFRSAEGASRLAAVRSYLSTAMKHSLDPLDVLVKLFAGDAWVPQRT